MSNVNMADGRNDSLSRPLMQCIKSCVKNTFLMLGRLLPQFSLFMKHRDIQMSSGLPTSIPPESLRESLSLRDSFTVSPICIATRYRDEKPFKCDAPVDGCEEAFNCEDDLKNHIDYDHSSTICYNCKEEFWEQKFEACPACYVSWTCFAPAK